jgi:hypothetical protein
MTIRVSQATSAAATRVSTWPGGGSSGGDIQSASIIINKQVMACTRC